MINEARQSMKEWICEEEQLIRADGASIGVGIRKKLELVRCKDCIHWDIGHTEECDNSDSVCFHNGWCKPEWYCADGEKRRDADES